MSDPKRGGTAGAGSRAIINILDRPLVAKSSRSSSSSSSSGNGEVSLSAFSFLFSEMVQYYQNRVLSIADLERK